MFGQKLKELRKKHSLTQSKLGQKIGVSPSAIGMYEQGYREPDNHTLLKICDLFDVSTDYLINSKSKCSIFFNPDEEHDFNDIINLFIRNLLKQKNIVYQGQKLEQQDLQKIAEAIKMAVAYYFNSEGFR